MRLGRIKKAVWDVLAVLDDRGECVLDQLEVLEPEMPTHVQAIYEMLFDRVPDYGPTREAVGRYGSRSLGDGIFEFRRGPRTGAKIRVAWFHGVPPHLKTIICTDAFKKREQTPSAERQRAIDLRTAYVVAPELVTIENLMGDS